MLVDAHNKSRVNLLEATFPASAAEMGREGVPFIGCNFRFWRFQGDSPEWQKGNAAMMVQILGSYSISQKS
jgi:hypothetical protein